VERYTDGAGRETGSVTRVYIGGNSHNGYSPLPTRTDYPDGTRFRSVTVDPYGVATTRRNYLGANYEADETVSGGVTNRETRVSGGATVEEKFWDGKWTRVTRSTSYDASGCRIETVTKESCNYPAFTESATTRDFLGRAVSVTTPLGVTSNVYDGASDRLVRVYRTGKPGTLYAYDELGDLSTTAQDADGDGVIGYAENDRITAIGTRYENISNDWWRVIASAVWSETGSDACVTTSVMIGSGAWRRPLHRYRQTILSTWGSILVQRRKTASP
jgi:hypothetical protein